MTLLEFTVNGPIISYIPVIVVSDSIGEYYAHFTFSSDWTGVKKVVFVDSTGVEDEATLIDDTCEIPATVMTGNAVSFSVSPYCGNLKTSNAATVPITPSGYRAVTPLPPVDPAETYVKTYTGANGVQFVRNNAGVIEFYDGTSWIVLWATEEAARATAEGERVLAELARAEAEAARVTAEGNASSGRVKAENDRVSAELAREQGESNRNSAYAGAESARDGLYATAESNRDDLYDAQEIVRDGLYSTAESGRGSQYDSAENARGILYDAAEDARDDLYDIAEAGRSALQTMQDNIDLANLSDTIRQSAMISRTGTGVKNGITLPNPISLKDCGARVEMLGQTLTNMVTNGNMVNTSGYVSYSGTLSASANKLFSTGNGVAAGVNIYKTIPTTVIGKKYRILVRMKATNAACTRFDAAVGGATVVLKSTPSENTEYTLSAVITAVSESANAILYHYYADAATANGKVCEIREFLIEDLSSAYGAGNEPTAAQMDIIAPAWFGSTVNVVNPALRTVGKNQVDISVSNWEQGTFDPSTGAESPNTTRLRSENFTVLAGASAMFSVVAGYKTLAAYFYDASGAFISRTTGTSNTLSLSIPSTAKTSRLVVSNSGDTTIVATDIANVKPQFEYGIVATAYEAYKSNVLSLIETLRSVVDTVAATNETQYTAATYAEWTVNGAGSTKGASGIHLVADGANDGAIIASAGASANSKFLFLYKVTATNLDSEMAITNSFNSSGSLVMPKVIGNNKIVVASGATPTVVTFFTTSGNTNGKYIDFSELRVIKLVPGSQLETDANTLTADQLAANIPYFATTGTAALSTVLRDRLYNLFGTWKIDRYVNPATGLKQNMATENAVVTGVPFIYRDGTSIIETSVIAPLVDSKIPYADVNNTYVPTLTWTTAVPTISSSKNRYVNDGEVCELDGSVVMSDGKGATNVTITLPVPVKVGAGNFTVFMQMKIGSAWTQPVVQVIEATNLITFMAAFSMTNGQAAELKYHAKYEVA